MSPVHLLDTAAPNGPRSYAEHLRVPSMSVGTAVLGVGAFDGQLPHTEDEIYVVVQGRARLWTPGRTVDVEPGSVAFVPALEEHRFVDVVEELHVIVVFAPAEHSNASAAQS
jgi:mannose-6-phosphate isomerase-like protein (cupin superfamily)